MVGLGGSLGLTSAFEREDPILEKQMLVKQLEACTDHRRKYQGMVVACQQQLEWPRDRYAKLPYPPNLLPVKEVPSVYMCCLEAWDVSVQSAFVTFAGLGILLACYTIKATIEQIRSDGFFESLGVAPPNLDQAVFIVLGLTLLAFAVPIFCKISTIFTAIKANGSAPAENTRR